MWNVFKAEQLIKNMNIPPETIEMSNVEFFSMTPLSDVHLCLYTCPYFVIIKIKVSIVLIVTVTFNDTFTSYAVSTDTVKQVRYVEPM